MIPRYGKFITSLVGVLVLYLQSYGATWHLVPAIMALAAALGVMGVPNAGRLTAPLTGTQQGTLEYLSGKVAQIDKSLRLIGIPNPPPPAPTAPPPVQLPPRPGSEFQRPNPGAQ